QSSRPRRKRPRSRPRRNPERSRDRLLARISLGRATAISEPLLHQLRTTPSVNWAEPVGSLRRGQDVVDSVELVASTDNARAVSDVLGTLSDGAHVRQHGSRQIDLTIDGTQVAVHCRVPQIAGAQLLHLTGSEGHVDRLRRMALN